MKLALLLSLPQIAKQSIQLLLSLLLLPHRAPSLEVDNVLGLQLVHIAARGLILKGSHLGDASEDDQNTIFCLTFSRVEKYWVSWLNLGLFCFEWIIS